MAYNYEYPYTDLSRYNNDWLINKVKELAAEWATVKSDWTDTQAAWEDLQNFVNTYFENLDVTEEIKSKLDSMATDGSLSALIKPLFDVYKVDIDGIVGQQNSNIDVIESRIDNITRLTTGSTTGDAELSDIRVGYDGITSANAGTSTRRQFGKAIKLMTPPSNDANFCTESGFYYFGSSDNFQNIPTGVVGGCIITFNGGTTTRSCQMLIAFGGQVVFTRYISSGVFGAWNKVNDNTPIETALSTLSGISIKALPQPTDYTKTYDLDTFLVHGYHTIGSSFKYVNTPNNDVAGLLVVFGGSTQVYQIFIGFDGVMSYRIKKLGEFTEWFKVRTISGGVTPPVVATNSRNYTIRKVDNAVNIYKQGVNGVIKYVYIHDNNSGINLNTYRLDSIWLCDNDYKPIKAISTSGADVEGVILLQNESDHIGGVHGDEQLVDYYIFIDGKPYTFDTISDMECDEIRIIVNTTLTHVNTNNICMNKNRQTTFDKDGVHVNCCWKPLEQINVASIRCCMFSIQKDCFTHWYDTSVNRTPIARNEVSGSAVTVSTDVNVDDLYYVGDVSVHHWAGNRGGNSNSTLLHDYGARYKSYFNCYDNYTANVGDEMYGENHFYVSC